MGRTQPQIFGRLKFKLEISRGVWLLNRQQLNWELLASEFLVLSSRTGTRISTTLKVDRLFKSQDEARVVVVALF